VLLSNRVFELRFLMDRTLSRNLAIVVPTAYLIGGVQTWLDYIVPGLVARDWSVTILPVHGLLHNALKYIQLHPFNRVHLVASPTGSREGRVRSLMKALAIVQPDLVLVVNIVDVYEAVARLRQRSVAGLRVVMALHGFNGVFFQDMKIFNRVLDGVITTNRLGVAAAVAISGIDKTRVHYAPCGVELGKPSLIELLDTPLMLLYSGRFNQKEKHIFDLPKILVELDKRKVPYQLKLAGSGPDEFELRSALSRFGERVEFLGQLDERTLHTTFYQPGAILLITSPSESGPIVAWEAMTHGVAVVTSSYLGIGREGSLRNKENCMIFPVSNSVAAADAIAQLQDITLRSRLIYEGYRLVSQKYSLEVSTIAWDRALQSILGYPPQSSVEIPVNLMLAGRLDRALGIPLAETFRNALGIKFRHSEPGGEWPHSYTAADEKIFFDVLYNLDRIN
jgi:glycosyltransferase involved in cell wall biosynthesis